MDFKSYIEAKRAELVERRAEIEALRNKIQTLEEECSTLEKAVMIVERDGVELAPPVVSASSAKQSEKRGGGKKRSHHKKKPAKTITLADAIRKVARELPSPFTTGDVRSRLDASLYKNKTSLASTMRRLGVTNQLTIVESGGPGKEATYSLPPTNRELFAEQPRSEERADEPSNPVTGEGRRYEETTKKA